MQFDPEPYLKRRYEAAEMEYRFEARTVEAAAAWKESLKAAFLRDLGGRPAAGMDLRPRVIEETHCAEYTRQRIVLETDEGLDMPLYVLIPRGGPPRRLPAVVTCHGHGTGSRDNVGLNPDGSFKTGDPGYSKSFGLELVKRGFLVVAPDLLGFAERMFEGDKNRWPEVRNSCHRLATYFLSLGTTLAAVRIAEISRVIDYLATRDDVDPDRIGCMGISGGGLVGAYASVFDERIKATVVSGFANTFKDSFLAMQHCVCMFVPGVLKHGEMSDLIGLIAPRPLLIESGTGDRNFPLAGSERAIAALNEIYAVWGAADNFEADVFEGGHEISGRVAYDWLERKLANG